MTQQGFLHENLPEENLAASPLANRMRPSTLEDIVGQTHI